MDPGVKTDKKAVPTEFIPSSILCKTAAVYAKQRVYGTGIVIPLKMIHPYYTPKFTQFQAILAKLPFFVDYAGFYVNIFMSTSELAARFRLSFSTFLTTYRVSLVPIILNIDFAIFLAGCFF